MERRSWMWRKKSSSATSPSSDKQISSILPPDFSDGGSLGSFSERFSDDHHHQASYSSTATQSPLDDQPGDDDDLNVLKQRLSDALLKLSAKDDLVAQHAKVAEEAVSGWEKAEKEVVALRQQLEDVTKKKGELEDRVSHLDAALKECMRQLRVARDDQQHLATKARELESLNSDLVSQISRLQDQPQADRRGETASTASSPSPSYVDGVEFRAKIEGLEKENSSLKHMLLCRAEELEIRIMERDLSSQAAEAARKQNLEAMKKVTRLEAECRKHRGGRISRSSCSGSPASSVGQSRIIMLPCAEINLMDDFLEMERLAASTDELPSAVSCETSNSSEGLQARIAELEEKLDERQCEVGMLQSQLRETDAELLVLQTELARANESIRAGEEELEGVKAMKEDAEEAIRMLLSRVEKESASAAENANKCVELQKRVWEMEHESELRREDEIKRVMSFKEELRAKQERELGFAAANFAECQKTISNLGRQLKSLAAMEEELLVS